MLVVRPCGILSEDAAGCVCHALPRLQVSFTINGESMGVAFAQIATFQPHLAYFPAVSLSQGEMCTMNMGSLPFKYPVDGYRPLAPLDAPHTRMQCRRLLLCVERLASPEQVRW